MSRNVIYRVAMTNDVGWRVRLYIRPSTNIATRASTAMNTRIVAVPPTAIDWDNFPIVKRSFGENTPRPIGMTESDSIEITWNLHILEEAIERGYPDAADLTHLLDYLQNPTSQSGVEITIDPTGFTAPDDTIALQTGNHFRLTVESGSLPFAPTTHPYPGSPTGGEVILFEGVQTDLEIEDGDIDDRDGTWRHITRVRHWWRVALEQIPVSALATHAYYSGPRVEGDTFWDQAYHDGVHPFLHIADRWEYFNPERAIERAETIPWITIWSSLQSLVSEWYGGHLRQTANILLDSKATVGTGNGGGTPTDGVTLFKLDHTENNDRGAVLGRGDWVVKARFGDDQIDSASPIIYLNPGGMCGPGADWGLYAVKTIWDMVQMCTEQSLQKCVPTNKGTFTSSLAVADAEVQFRPMFDSPYTTTETFSDETFTLYKKELSPAGSKKPQFRDGLIAEVESGMEEGSGDDEEKISVKNVGIEQTDGFNLPFFIHNMPKVGEAEKDKTDAKKYFKDSPRFSGYLKYGFRAVLQMSSGYEACIWYRETSPPTTIFDTLPHPPHFRAHGSPIIEIGNGITYNALPRTSLPTEPDTAYLPALMAAANLTEQRETSWAATAAHALLAYMVTRWSFTIDFDLPGHKALPQYVGSTYRLCNDAGVAKGLRMWRDTPYLSSYPTSAMLVSTELNIKTGRATCKFYANDHMD